MSIHRYVGCAALALGLALGSVAAHAQNAAERAVEAAKEHSGTTINTLEEAGLMAMLGQTFTGPKWEAMQNMGPFEKFLMLAGVVPSDASSCPD